MIPRPATAADFGFIHSLAGHPDNAPFLTDEDDAGLTVYLTDPDARLQIWEDDGVSMGYALWCGLASPSRVLELRRLALATKGGGRGQGFVKALTTFGFEDLGAGRVWLDASGENPRAVRVYEQVGYTLEGTLRAHWYRPTLGRCVDMLLFGILRAEWEQW